MATLPEMLAGVERLKRAYDHLQFSVDALERDVMLNSKVNASKVVRNLSRARAQAEKIREGKA